MAWNEAKLIVSDIEGCLSPGKGAPLEMAQLGLLQDYNRAARDRGLPPLTLCTGRPQPFVEAFAQMLAVTLPCVCENGALVFDPKADQTYRHPAIGREQLDVLADLRHRLETDIMTRIPHRREPGKEICISLNPIAKLEDYPGKIRALYEALLTEVDATLFNVTHSASAVDITPKGIDKAAGVRFLSDLTGVPLSAMLGIGDTRGDLPFLEIVGKVAVPANAQEELGGLAAYRSSASSAGGVYDAVLLFSGQGGLK